MTALIVVILGLGLLAACSTARAPLCAGGAPDQSGLAGYRLGPHDSIKVTVFRQPDLSGQFALDGEGSLALPLIGNVPAGGLTTRELEDEIERRLQTEGYLVNPQVGVEPLKHRSFYVLGEVRRPGSYEYRNGISVINAVALAGGYTYRADTSQASIERGGCSFPIGAETGFCRATSSPSTSAISRLPRPAAEAWPRAIALRHLGPAVVRFSVVVAPGWRVRLAH